MPKKYSISIQKRFERLPTKGFFTRPKRILTTKAKNSRLKGKVLKQYAGLLEVNEGVRIRRMVKTYIELLKRSGTPILETRVLITPTRNGKYQLNIVQPFIEQKFILSNYLRNCTPQEAADAFRQMLQNARRVKQFNSQNVEKIGLDPKSANYAIVDGKVVQIDFYPPQIKGTESTTPQDLTQRLRSRTLKVMAKLLNGRVRRRINQELDKHYDGDFLARRIFSHFKAARPEIRSLLEEVYIEFRSL
jgi:hypothetical protein